MSSNPLHQQETRFHDLPNHVSVKKEGELLKNYQRSMPRMHLPTLSLPTGNYLQEKMRRKNNKSSKGKSNTSIGESPVSVIDGILDVIDYEFKIDTDDEQDYEEEFMIVPVKEDNYVNKKSRLSNANKQRRELLLDNASAITEALRALEDNEGMAGLVLSSGDEESLDSRDIDDDCYDSDDDDECDLF